MLVFRSIFVVIAHLLAKRIRSIFIIFYQIIFFIFSAEGKKYIFLVFTETGWTLEVSYFWGGVANDGRNANIISFRRVIVLFKSTEVDAEMVQLMIRSKS